MSEQQKDNVLINEYINILSLRLNETNLSNVLLQAKVNILTKENELLIQELNKSQRKTPAKKGEDN